MSTTRILVISPTERICRILAAESQRMGFELLDVRPGPAVVNAIRRERPHIAIVDGIHGRADAALLEIAVLKDVRPEVQIIVLSECSSVRDAGIVEQGIFYYMAAPPGEELLRVVDAATRLIARKNGGARAPLSTKFDQAGRRAARQPRHEGQ